MTGNQHGKRGKKKRRAKPIFSSVSRAPRTLDCGNFPLSLYHVKGASDQTAEINIGGYCQVM